MPSERTRITNALKLAQALGIITDFGAEDPGPVWTVYGVTQNLSWSHRYNTPEVEAFVLGVAACREAREAIYADPK